MILIFAASGPVAEDKSSSNKVQTKSEFEDLFDGLVWVTPSLTQEPCKQDIVNLPEKVCTPTNRLF